MGPSALVASSLVDSNRYMSMTCSSLTSETLMCFAQPGRVISIDGSIVEVLTDRGNAHASLVVLEAAGESIEVGDWVLLSLGLVLQRVSERDGQALFDELREMAEQGNAHGR
jgi:hydrogenase assembly chaperone HypC/HupF